MRVGIKIPQILTLNVVRCIGLVLTILKRYDTSMEVSWYWIAELTPFIGVVLK